ncbi:hypothetical protein Nmel_003610, partial [Mimus melanotis]
MGNIHLSTTHPAAFWGTGDRCCGRGTSSCLADSFCQPASCGLGTACLTKASIHVDEG